MKILQYFHRGVQTCQSYVLDKHSELLNITQSIIVYITNSIQEWWCTRLCLTYWTSHLELYQSLRLPRKTSRKTWSIFQLKICGIKL